MLENWNDGMVGTKEFYPFNNDFYCYYNTLFQYSANPLFQSRQWRASITGRANDLRPGSKGPVFYGEINKLRVDNYSRYYERNYYHDWIDKNSLFPEWIVQKRNLYIGFSHSPTYRNLDKLNLLISK